jgi:hypothetical protein
MSGKECFECGKQAKHEHHVVPKTLGGTKTVPLCEECHSKVHNKDLSVSKLQKEAVKRTIELFKKEGKQWGGGGWNKTDPTIYPEVVNLRNDGIKLKDIAAKFGISIPTVWKILKFRTQEEIVTCN